MSETDRQTYFQMTANDLSNEMLSWLLDQDVYVPDFGSVVLFRMPATTAEKFLARFPDAMRFLLTE